MKLNELILRLNIMRTLRNGVHGDYDYHCQSVCIHELNNMFDQLDCNAHVQTYSTMTSLWSSILCPKMMMLSSTKGIVLWVIALGVELRC